MDAETAFLNAKLDEELHIKQRLGIEVPTICHIHITPINILRAQLKILSNFSKIRFAVKFSARNLLNEMLNKSSALFKAKVHKLMFNRTIY